MSDFNQAVLNRFVAFGGLAFVALLVVGAFFYGLLSNKFSIGYNDGYEPTQPIPFSHKKHAGDYKIDCKYCHVAVERSRHASVPSLNICMNCHTSVKTDSPLIQKLAKHYYEGKPIAWEKVHLLPEFVKFNHAPHVNAGIDCTTCHGPVETMARVKQVETLSMGFCVDCHRVHQDINMGREKKKIKSGLREGPPINCSTCHY